MNKATVDSVMMYVWAMRAAATEQILEPCGANIGKLEIADAALRAEVERLAAQAEPAPAPVGEYPAKALEGVEPVACLVNADLGAMVWPISDLNEAGTYCDEGEFPEPLYSATTVSALQARIAELEALLQEAGRTIDNLTVFAGRSGQSIQVRASIDAARKESK